MSLSKIITNLEVADGPSRRLDQSIALQVGYRLSIDQGLLDGERDRKIWWYGEPPKEVRLPDFTSSIKSAVDLAKTVGIDPDDNDCAVRVCLAVMKELRARTRSS